MEILNDDILSATARKNILKLLCWAIQLDWKLHEPAQLPTLFCQDWKAFWFYKIYYNQKQGS